MSAGRPHVHAHVQHETRGDLTMKPSRYGYSGAVVLALVTGIWAADTQSTHGQQKQVPRFGVEPSWPKPGPRSWVTDRLGTEEMGATCTDANGRVVHPNRGDIPPIDD